MQLLGQQFPRTLRSFPFQAFFGELSFMLQHGASASEVTTLWRFANNIVLLLLSRKVYASFL